LSVLPTPHLRGFATLPSLRAVHFGRGRRSCPQALVDHRWSAAGSLYGLSVDSWVTLAASFVPSKHGLPFTIPAADNRFPRSHLREQRRATRTCPVARSWSTRDLLFSAERMKTGTGTATHSGCAEPVPVFISPRQPWPTMAESAFWVIWVPECAALMVKLEKTKHADPENSL
jgi:hypothetical protein